MSFSRKLQSFLDENHIKYITVAHSRAFTAQEIASSMHIPGKELAKTVIVKLDGKFAMVVLPASFKVDFEALKSATGAAKVELATEMDFQNLFPDCETGAMPPFGNLYDIPVYVSKELTADEEIVFNACTHTDTIRMHYKDYEQLVKPIVIQIAKHLI
jgi:Ala-tRNA(Pro) deacylase